MTYNARNQAMMKAEYEEVRAGATLLPSGANIAEPGRTLVTIGSDGSITWADGVTAQEIANQMIRYDCSTSPLLLALWYATNGENRP